MTNASAGQMSVRTAQTGKSSKNAPINYAEVMRRKLAKDNEDQMTAFESLNKRAAKKALDLKSMRATL